MPRIEEGKRAAERVETVALRRKTEEDEAASKEVKELGLQAHSFLFKIVVNHGSLAMFCLGSSEAGGC